MIVSECFLSRISRCIVSLCFALSLLVQPVLAQIGYVEEPGAEGDVAHAYERLRTLRERVGQLLMVGWNGCGADETLETLVTDYAVGGVILFEYNIRGMRDSCPDSRVDPSEPDPVEVPQNTARLTNSIQNLASRTPAAIPVLVAVDQEQGRSLIIEKGMTRFPSAMALGATRNEDLAYRAGLVTGRELSAVGINMNLAPVADIHRNTANDIISDRSYGGSPEIVSRMSTQFMNGLHAGGVLATAKHFPGHGDSAVNPHDGLPVVNYTPEEIIDELMAPFRNLVDEGVDAIMPAHMHFPRLEARRRPVTLSRPIIERYVRGAREEDGLDFDGVVITDDLVVMKAIRHAGPGGAELPVERVALGAAEAGNDMLMFIHVAGDPSDRVFSLRDFDRTFDDLVEYFQSNPDQLARSVKRVLRLKRRVHGSFEPEDWRVNVDAVASVLRRPEHLHLAGRAAAESITLINDESALFGEGRGPLSNIDVDQPLTIVAPVFARDDLTPRILDKLFISEGDSDRYRALRVRYGEMGAVEIEEKAAEIVKASADAQVLIFGFTTKYHVEVLRRVIRGLGGKTPIVAIAFNDPAMLDYASIAQITYISAYANVDVSNEAVVEALAGDIPVKDSDYLPVTIEGWQRRLDLAPFTEREFSCAEALQEGRRIFGRASAAIADALSDEDVSQARPYMRDANEALRVFGLACSAAQTDDEIARAQAEFKEADTAARLFRYQLDELQRRLGD